MTLLYTLGAEDGVWHLVLDDMTNVAPLRVCGTCTSYRVRGSIFNVSHCKDAVSPLSDYVGDLPPDQTCERWEQRK